LSFEALEVGKLALHNVKSGAKDVDGVGKIRQFRGLLRKKIIEDPNQISM